jgi:hypothetical protein
VTDEVDPNNRRWRKSSYSGGGNDCVEVATSVTSVTIRDSNSSYSSILHVSRHEWRTFLQSIDTTSTQ